jgi:chemotaxis protein methyltransferase CheR
MDAVFCRNVMIYFDTPARQRVLRLIYDKLVPGGYLLLGHSENLINLSADFELVHLRGDLVYRKPDPTGGNGL